MKALVIDGSALFQEILHDIFSGSQMLPEMCGTAKEALALLKQEQFSFICVSKYLKDSDGLQLIKQIRVQKGYEHTPLILFTSDETSSAYAEALTLGATEVFHKRDVELLDHYIRRYTLTQIPLRGRILYVEDALSQRQVGIAMLQQHGLDVDAFGAAEAAWEAFQQNDYDLVITDLLLEGVMTGIGLCSQIRRLDGAKGGVPIIAVTGFDDMARRIDLYQMGVSEYVIKPVIREELLARVRNLLNTQYYYRECARLRRKAEQSSVAKSRFIADMGHSMLSPVNAILSHAERMRIHPDFPVSDKLSHELAAISQASRDIAELLDETIDISRIEAGIVTSRAESVNLNLVSTDVISLLVDDCKTARVHIDNSAVKSINVHADASHMMRVMTYLLKLGVNLSAPDTTLVLGTEKRGANHVVLWMHTAGVVLTEAQQDTLFQPFHATTYLADDSGLGLAIMQRLIALMHGQVDITTMLREGMRIEVQLPQA
jgi:DNA-binding response OmpR family regulator